MVARPKVMDARRQALVGRSLDSYRRSNRWRVLEYLFWCIPVAAYFAFPTNYLLLSQVAITALFALSLDLIFGYAGILSLGHAAFFGIGAYTAGMLGAHGMGWPVLGLVGAGVVAGLLGFLTSFLVLRGNDLSRLMVTLGVSLILFALANQLYSITGGVNGMSNVVIKPILGFISFDVYGRVGYAYSLIVLFVLFWIARRLVHSPFGVGLRGIHLNRLRMPALGVPVNRRLVAVYTIGGIYAGVAGALLTQTNAFVTIDVFSIERSADLLLILIFGGAGYLYGGLIGAAIFDVGRSFLSGVSPQYWQFWLGIVLVAVVLFAPHGILGTARRWRDTLRQRRAARDESRVQS